MNCTTYAGASAQRTATMPTRRRRTALGLTQTGNAELDPEESTSFTAGIVLEPIRNLSFTLDYWHIEVEGPDHRRDRYLGGRGAVLREQRRREHSGHHCGAGRARSGVPECAAGASASSSLRIANQDKQTVSGWDFGANLTVPIGGLTLRSNLELRTSRSTSSTTDAGDVFEYRGHAQPLQHHVLLGRSGVAR